MAVNEWEHVLWGSLAFALAASYGTGRVGDAAALITGVSAAFLGAAGIAVVGAFVAGFTPAR